MQLSRYCVAAIVSFFVSVYYMAKTLIVILGPTGVGKTELCLQVAEHLNIPIINADSRQIFEEIPIGTAAPTAAQRARVPHYFVGTHHIGDYYSASMYESDVMQLLTADLFERYDTALLTGGSMMYIDAVCNGIDDIPTVDDETREWMKQRLAEEGLERLVAELKLLDPEHWAIVDRNNPRRVVHALEICHCTGQTYTSFRKSERKERPFNIIKIGLTRPRDVLYDRINARVLDMIDAGLEHEALAVYPQRSENALNTVGYKEMFDYLDGLVTMEQTIDRIQSNTRRYARKQLTWYKRDEEMRWFDPVEVGPIIAYIDERIEAGKKVLQTALTSLDHSS